MSEELADRIYRKLVAHEIDYAAAELEAALCIPRQRFAPLAELVFTNDVHSIGQLLNAFHAECEKASDVKCFLLQHNGFVFNHDLWYFEPQAYDVIKDISTDFEWLCYPAKIGNAISLSGLESVQKDFEWYAENELFDDEEWTPIAEVAELLVKVRFTQLIKRVVESSSLSFRIPLITNAYHCEAYCRFDPGENG